MKTTKNSTAIISESVKLNKTTSKQVQELEHQSFIVVCKSVGNPDHGQTPQKAISPERRYLGNTLQEVSTHCMNYIQEFNLGAGNWARGQILHPLKGVFAVVSYNGRVWQDIELRKEFTDSNLL